MQWRRVERCGSHSPPLATQFVGSDNVSLQIPLLSLSPSSTSFRVDGVNHLDSKYDVTGGCRHGQEESKLESPLNSETAPVPEESGEPQAPCEASLLAPDFGEDEHFDQLPQVVTSEVKRHYGRVPMPAGEYRKLRLFKWFARLFQWWRDYKYRTTQDSYYRPTPFTYMNIWNPFRPTLLYNQRVVDLQSAEDIKRFGINANLYYTLMRKISSLPRDTNFVHTLKRWYLTYVHENKLQAMWSERRLALEYTNLRSALMQLTPVERRLHYISAMQHTSAARAHQNSMGNFAHGALARS